jgi:KRAB domain-containing zinc finger protein
MSEKPTPTPTPVAGNKQTPKRKRQNVEPTVDNIIAEKKQKTAVHKCPECEKLFGKGTLLKQHIKGTHRGVHECGDCNKVFKGKNDLTRHILIHTGERPFICYACEKTFVQKIALTEHARIHTGERPYQCSKCDKCFTTSSVMVRHMREQHGKPNTSHMCGICKSLFKRKNKLTTHQKTHVDKNGNHIRIECKVEGCEEVSTSNQTAKQHIASHSNIRCAECDTGFLNNSNLTRHMKNTH